MKESLHVMNEVASLISRLSRLGISLNVQGGNLKYEAPVGSVNEEIKRELVSRKAEIIRFLQGDGRPKRIVPTTANQRAIWLLESLSPGKSNFNNSLAFRTPPDLPLEALEKAVLHLVDRHPALNSRLLDQGRLLESGAFPENAFRFHIIDNAPSDEAGLLGTVEKEILRPFDLSVEPLFRTVLFRSGGTFLGLAFVAHHIISDDRSIRTAVLEYFLCLEAILGGKPPKLPLRGKDFLDFCQLEERILKHQEGERLWEYWKGRLAGRIPRLELPLRQPAQGRGKTLPLPMKVALGRERTRSLMDFCKAEGVTPFMLLVALLKVLLHKYSGQTDLIVGSPFQNRPDENYRNAVGYFANVLPLRSELLAEMPFRRFLAGMRTTILESIEHQAFPFPTMVERLNPEREGGDSPLFNVMVDSLLSGPGVAGTHEFASGGFRFPYLCGSAGAGDYDLILWILEEGGEVVLDFRVDASRFHPEMGERMARHFLTLTNAVLAAPDTEIADLGILEEAEKSDLIEACNQTDRDVGEDRLPLLVFDRQAAAHPARIAVHDARCQVTYARLAEESSRLAWKLSAAGAGPGSVIGVCMEKSAGLVAALLAIWRVGAAYLPLDPAFPRERTAFVLAESRSVLIIADGKSAPGLNGYGLDVLLWEAGWEEKQPAHDPAFPSRSRMDLLAYIIYTSGSTGRPKGVAISQSSVANFLVSMLMSPGLGAEDCLLSVTSLSFDISVLEIFLPLMAGARVGMADAMAGQDGRILLSEIANKGATILQATPSTWKSLAIHFSGFRPILRKALCGGEPCPAELAESMGKIAEEVWNMYGPTETTVWSTIGRLCPESGSVHIGGPIGNTRVYILDSGLQPVPAGVTGEIFISGAGVATGYINRKEEEEFRFLSDPFRSSENGRMYRTGDLGSRSIDGNIRHLGRSDDQVKVRGFRIELKEVESRLLALPGVLDALAVARVGKDGSGYLAAYIIPSEPALPPDIDSIRMALKEQLPAYMLPSRYMMLERFPMTHNLKVDRKALPEPDMGRTGIKSRYVAPVLELEMKIASIWSQLLGVPQVGLEDNFFELGGHSLLLVEIHDRLTRETGLNLALIDLFNLPSVGRLANHMARLSESRSRPS